jgi:LysM repeat protein
MNKESKNQLSDEFKKDIHESGAKRNVLGTILAFIAIILVFGTIGVAGYELIFKPEKTQQKTSEEKIESRPEQNVETPKAETPSPPVASPPETTVPTSTEYTVVSGDSFSSIANANGMSSADLMKYNGITSEELQIGQIIKIPK